VENTVVQDSLISISQQSCRMSQQLLTTTQRLFPWTQRNLKEYSQQSNAGSDKTLLVYVHLTQL